MAKEKRKFEQQFYVGDVIQDHRDGEDFQWKVLSAKFVECHKEAWGYDQWEYDIELAKHSAKLYGEREEAIQITALHNPYKLIQPGEARIWA